MLFLTICSLACYSQLEPKDLAEQLKRGGAAIPAIRPGKQTAEYVTATLTRMSILGSVFLGARVRVCRLLGSVWCIAAVVLHAHVGSSSSFSQCMVGWMDGCIL
jgi:preprotein translocase subunit SecY